jgi:serine protease Do
MNTPFRTILLATLVTLGACSDPRKADSEVTGAGMADTTARAAQPDRRQPHLVDVAMRELPDFTALVQEYGDAVVNVRVIGHAPGGGSDAAADALQDFFRRFGHGAPEEAPDSGASEGPLMHGAGSGFIVSSDGYILTNAHVVANADEVTVKLTDRREFPAKVIGADTRTDVAVIKIDAKNLPVVKIGDDKALKTGEWVLAIGAPFGLENTATAGIVSGTSRSVGGETPVPFIQTDVAVNPGNSGGPLFNLRGEVVGINSMIFSQSGGYMGISFAVPIDIAMDVREQLIKTGHVVRGRIGVVAQDVDAGLASSFKLDRPHGALISSVQEDGPAEEGGVKAGDVILKVDDQDIEQSADLSNVIAKTPPGKDTELTVWRGGKEKELTVRVAKLEEPGQKNADNSKPQNQQPEGAKLGLVVRPLTPQEKQSVETDGNIVVAGVQGSAARAGIQPGDIILAVNNKTVKNVKDLREVASKLRAGDPAALLVERGGTQIFVPVRAG